jgi:hypothetical protein
MGLQIVQNAYVTADLASTCERLYRDFNIGPFILAEGLELYSHRYRGHSDETIVLDAAFAQAGPLNLEVIQVKSNGPSAIADMFVADGPGVHHVACFCDDYESERDRLSGLGYAIASEFAIADDLEISFVDTRSAFGHMMELYPRHSLLLDLYDRVRRAQLEWDRKELFLPW